jgi:alkanesulfonate monooxygenase SsuD/methylene tetrahydromethanopterin reductase-like flavin-dependent oxidoreductase (luciferase family)
VKVGAHLPLADFGDGTPTATDLVHYARVAVGCGMSTLSANDHLVWGRPWLDGPTALASVAAEADRMTLATSITLPVARHPVVVAKTLTSLAAMARGAVVGGLGPGSSRADLAAVGLPFEERWARFDEAFTVVRALVRGEPAAAGTYYRADDVLLAPLGERPPQVWFASWGSEHRLAAMAAVADGWFASAYNATPEHYRATRSRLDEHLRAAGRDPATVPDAVATTWLYVTERRAEAEHVLVEVLAPVLGRDPATLGHLPIGGAEHCAAALDAYAQAGAREVLVWPLRDPVRQLEKVTGVLEHFPW